MLSRPRLQPHDQPRQPESINQTKFRTERERYQPLSEQRPKKGVTRRTREFTYSQFSQRKRKSLFRKRINFAIKFPINMRNRNFLERLMKLTNFLFPWL